MADAFHALYDCPSMFHLIVIARGNLCMRATEEYVTRFPDGCMAWVQTLILGNLYACIVSHAGTL